MKSEKFLCLRSDEYVSSGFVGDISTDTIIGHTVVPECGHEHRLDRSPGDFVWTVDGKQESIRHHIAFASLRRKK